MEKRIALHLLFLRMERLGTEIPTRSERVLRLILRFAIMTSRLIMIMGASLNGQVVFRLIGDGSGKDLREDECTERAEKQYHRADDEPEAVVIRVENDHGCERSKGDETREREILQEMDVLHHERIACGNAAHDHKEREHEPDRREISDIQEDPERRIAAVGIFQGERAGIGDRGDDEQQSRQHEQHENDQKQNNIGRNFCDFHNSFIPPYLRL